MGINKCSICKEFFETKDYQLLHKIYVTNLLSASRKFALSKGLEESEVDDFYHDFIRVSEFFNGGE